VGFFYFYKPINGFNKFKIESIKNVIHIPATNDQKVESEYSLSLKLLIAELRQIKNIMRCKKATSINFLFLSKV
jgi:hypothetical protein